MTHWPLARARAAMFTPYLLRNEEMQAPVGARTSPMLFACAYFSTASNAARVFGQSSKVRTTREDLFGPLSRNVRPREMYPRALVVAFVDRVRYAPLTHPVLVPTVTFHQPLDFFAPVSPACPWAAC